MHLQNTDIQSIWDVSDQIKILIDDALINNSIIIAATELFS